MADNDILKNLSEKIEELFNSSKHVKDDVQEHLNNLLQSSFDKLNLVTREEFDAQVAALSRAEATIAELEKKLDELEQNADRESGQLAG